MSKKELRKYLRNLKKSLKEIKKIQKAYERRKLFIASLNQAGLDISKEIEDCIKAMSN